MSHLTRSTVDPQNGPAATPSPNAHDALWQRIRGEMEREFTLIRTKASEDFDVMRASLDSDDLANKVNKLAWLNDSEKREGIEKAIGLQKILAAWDASDTPLETVPDALAELGERVNGLSSLIQEAEKRRPQGGFEAVDPRAEYVEVVGERMRQEPRLRAMTAVDPRLTNEYQDLLDIYIRRGPYGFTQDQQALMGRANCFMDDYADSESYRGAFEPEILNALRPDFTPGAGLFISPTMDARIRQKLTEFSPIMRLATRTPCGSNTYTWMQETGALPTSTTVAPHAAGGTANTNEELWEDRETKVYLEISEIPVIRTMLEDSQRDLLGLLTNMVSRRFGKKTSQWAVTGDGTGQPWGVTQDIGVTTVNTGVGDEVRLVSFLFMFSQLPSFYRSGASLVVGDDAYTAMIIEQDSDNRQKWQPVLRDGTPATFGGYRVDTDSYYQSADDKTIDKVTFTADDIVGTFAKWSDFAIMPERHGIRFFRSESAKAGESNQVDFAFHLRQGFAVDLAEAGRNLKVSE